MSKIRITPVLSLMILALGPGVTGSVQGPARSVPGLTEELIVEKDAAALEDDTEDMVSEDGRHAAWRTGREKNWAVMLDGSRQGGEFDEVKSLEFSGDGQHLAFAGRRDKSWLMVLDGKEPAQSFEKLSEPLFSPDGERLLHFGKRQGKWSVFVNGEPLGAAFDWLVYAMFSPDGRRLAFVGRRGAKLIVTVDLKEGPPFDVIGGMSFSGDGRHVSYAGADIKTGFPGDKGLGRVVIDGEPGTQYEGEKPGAFINKQQRLVPGYEGQLICRVHGITSPVFSADGSRVAYAAHQDKDKEAVVVDGQPGPPFVAIVHGPRFGPDGKRIAYAARRGKDDEVVVVDGQPGPSFRSIVSPPRFCHEGRHLAYVASDAEGKFLVVDGERVGGALLPGADFVEDLGFAPDGRRVGYVAVAGSFWAAVARNMATGKNYTKAVGRSAKRRVYVDGQPGPEYDTRDVSGFGFTSDSRHVIYVVHGLQEGPRKVSFVVTNRTEGKRYDSVWARTIRVQDTGAVVYVAQSGRKFLRVTQPIQ